MNNLPPEKNRRILVIDDNRAIHDDFRKILCPDTIVAAALDVTETELFGKPANAVAKIHYEIDSAYQGQEGVSLVQKALETGRPYAMAFVDIRMPPGMDGVETTQKIWVLDPDLQIVLCTAYSDYSWDEMSEKIGDSDGLVILKKPFDTVEALQLAHALTEKWWLHQQSRKKMGELESMVAERTAALATTNEALQIENMERKKTEEVLRESEERFSGAFEYAPIGVALVLPDGRWFQVNRVLCELLGYSEAELLTRTFQDITHPEDLQADLENVRQLLAGEIRSYQMEKRYVHARGHFITVLLNVSLIRDRHGQPRYFISQIQDITERKRAEELLQESQQRLALAKESAHFGIWDWNVAPNKMVWDARMYELYGIREEAFSGAVDAWQKSLHPEDRARGDYAVHAALDGIKDFHMEFRVVWPNGEIRYLEGQAIVQRAGDGSPTRMIGVNWDITERKKLEAQLIQSQKMETVGKLAGGIAHEFNSILTAIIGQSELLLNDLPAGSPLVASATEISRAAGRAATLTRQLLAYGRKQFLQPEILDLNRVLASMAGVFQHLMGTDVNTQINPATGLHAVKADAGQIEQVIMNMVINARDAMPNGGKLTLETANITFDRDSVGRYAELKPGEYVMLAVTDTGTGMSEAIKARLFEPFFSTKGVGQGTGLGLSTCYGIIKQSGGHISVYSEVGRGTTFKIYLPQIETSAKIPVQRLDAPDLPHGTETILLVEDDPALREMAATLLRRLGYTVFGAANGVEALSVQHEHGTGHIDLLFTDVVMPHMSGRELADRVRALYPDTKILFTSAYTENAIVQQGVFNKGVALLQKPFTPSALAHKLREALDQPLAPEPDSAQKTFGFTNPSGPEAAPGNKS